MSGLHHQNLIAVLTMSLKKIIREKTSSELMFKHHVLVSFCVSQLYEFCNCFLLSCSGAKFIFVFIEVKIVPFPLDRI